MIQPSVNFLIDGEAAHKERWHCWDVINYYWWAWRSIFTFAWVCLLGTLYTDTEYDDCCLDVRWVSVVLVLLVCQIPPGLQRHQLLWLVVQLSQLVLMKSRCGFCEFTPLVQFLLRYRIKGLFTCRLLVSLSEWQIQTSATWWWGESSPTIRLCLVLKHLDSQWLLVLLRTYIQTCVLCIVCEMYIWFGNVTYEQDWWWNNMKCVTPWSSCTHTDTHRPRVSMLMN